MHTVLNFNVFECQAFRFIVSVCICVDFLKATEQKQFVVQLFYKVLTNGIGPDLGGRDHNVCSGCSKVVISRQEILMSSDNYIWL